MPRFRYNAIDADQQPATGVIEAGSVAEAASRLEAKGLLLKAIASASEEVTKPTESLSKAVRRLYSFRDGLLEPLTAYAKELRGKRKQQLRSLIDALRHDDERRALAAAASEPDAWAPLLASAVPGSEADESVFARFVRRDQRTQQQKQYRSLAFAYPAFVCLLLLLVMWPIATLIVPTFRDIYQDFGLELPASTLLLLAIGSFFSHGGGVLLSVLALVGVAVVVTWPRWGPAWLSTLAARLNIELRQGVASAGQLARDSADLLEAQLPIQEAMRYAGSSMNDRSIRPATAYAVRSDLPAESRVSLLRDLSACYTENSVKRASWVTGTVGPAATILIGIVIGFTVIALFAPLIQLVQALT